MNTERIWDILLLVGGPRFLLASCCYIGISRDWVSMYTCLVNYWPVEQRNMNCCSPVFLQKTHTKNTNTQPASLYTFQIVLPGIMSSTGREGYNLLPENLHFLSEKWGDWHAGSFPFDTWPLFSRVLPVDFLACQTITPPGLPSGQFPVTAVVFLGRQAQILLRLSSIEAANDQDDATLQVGPGVWLGVPWCFCCPYKILKDLQRYFLKDYVLKWLGSVLMCRVSLWKIYWMNFTCYCHQVVLEDFFKFCVLSTTEWLGGFFWCLGFSDKFPMKRIGMSYRLL